MEYECSQCHEIANGVRCNYICKGILPKWKSANRPSLYARRVHHRSY